MNTSFLIGIALGCSFCAIVLSLIAYFKLYDLRLRLIPLFVEYETRKERELLRKKYPVASGEFPTSSDELDKLQDELFEYFSSKESEWKKT